MVPMTASLMTKIKTLNETVWERRASEPAIREWLENFASPSPPALDERHYALFLLSNFMFFGDREIRGLLKSLYRDLYRYPIIEKIRQTNSDTLDSSVIKPAFDGELQRTRFLGVGNPSESGCHLLYYFRQENELAKDLFIHTHQIFKRSSVGAPVQLRNPGVTRYVFIDDFCGSGKQGTEYSREVVEEIKRIEPNALVAYYVLFATSKGIDKVRSATQFDDVKAIYELDSSFKCFTSESRYFRSPLTESERSFCEGFCRQYGEKLAEAPNALGFDDSQLLIGFHHNVPDNTLPVIWFNQPGFSWKPIFRRYPKMELVSR